MAYSLKVVLVDNGNELDSHHNDVLFLMRVYSEMGRVAAIKVLRFMYPDRLTLLEAHNIINELCGEERRD